MSRSSSAMTRRDWPSHGSEPRPGWPPDQPGRPPHATPTDRTACSPPLELYAQMARRAAWASCAITDHDTLAGYRELRDGRRRRRPAGGPQLIPAIEINTHRRRRARASMGSGCDGGELHILGYGVDPDDAGARRRARAASATARDGSRCTLIIERLREQGMPIDEQIAPALATARTARRPAARRAGAGRAPASAERRGRLRRAWIDRSGPATCRARACGPREAIEAIRAAGGIPVLAHSPAAPDRPDVIDELMDWGLRGLEVYYRALRAGDRGPDGRASRASSGCWPPEAATTMATRMDYAEAQADDRTCRDAVGGARCSRRSSGGAGAR